MKWDAELLNCIVAVIGGVLGAALSGLGSFVLFGLVGVLGFLYLILGQSDVFMNVVTGSIVLRPSVGFLGGCVAAAYARRRGLIKCGKDIGRSFASFDRFDILAVGGAAGLAGYVVNRAVDALFAGRFDTIALTVFAIPLFLKYAWRLTTSSDCEASSHAVPSPYRFFEKFTRPKGKVLVALIVGLCTSLLTVALYLQPMTRPYAGSLGFFASAVLLFPLFMSIPVPATHHFSGPAGIATALWLSSRDAAPAGATLAIVVLWGIAAAQVALLAADIMEKLFFTDGDIHVDPPAMAIFATTAIMVGIIPLTGVYVAGEATQAIAATSIIAVALAFNLRGEWAARFGVRPA